MPLSLRRGSHHLLLQPPLRRAADGRVRLVPHLDPHHVHRPQEARPRSRGVALLQVRGEEEQGQGKYSGKELPSKMPLEKSLIAT